MAYQDDGVASLFRQQPRSNDNTKQHTATIIPGQQRTAIPSPPPVFFCSSQESSRSQAHRCLQLNAAACLISLRLSPLSSFPSLLVPRWLRVEDLVVLTRILHVSNIRYMLLFLPL